MREISRYFQNDKEAKKKCVDCTVRTDVDVDVVDRTTRGRCWLAGLWMSWHMTHVIDGE
jgi:hypothetical protein